MRSCQHYQASTCAQYVSRCRLRGVCRRSYLEDPSMMILSIVDRGADIARCSLAALVVPNQRSKAPSLVFRTTPAADPLPRDQAYRTSATTLDTRAYLLASILYLPVPVCPLLRSACSCCRAAAWLPLLFASLLLGYGCRYHVVSQMIRYRYLRRFVGTHNAMFPGATVHHKFTSWDPQSNLGVPVVGIVITV